MSSSRILRIATRRSALARWQAEWVARRLRAIGAEVEIVPVVTEGDRSQRGPVQPLEGRGVFTREIQTAVLDDRADLAVHSMKDLPTDPVEGIALAAVPLRGPVADVLVTRSGVRLEELPQGALVGTGSLRRQAQLKHARPDLRLEAIRGNVDTRLRKLDRGLVEAVVLAEAGLQRLGLARRIEHRLPPDVMLPAVGQGALAIETRADDKEVRHWAAALDHAPSRAAVLAERTMLAMLQGGCLAPIAAWARFDDHHLVLDARVLDADGSRRLDVSETGGLGDPESLGETAAGRLLDLGAADLLHAARDAG